MVRPKGNKWFLGLRVTQLREAIVFDKADGQAQIMCISFTSRGFFSGFDNYWRDAPPHMQNQFLHALSSGHSALDNAGWLIPATGSVLE